ncbi:ribonuclease H family protein [Microbacterium oxydans]|uniref:ribonuclease H family protein n=1 Tax=Microbacterium oxydans TaxID=82380 RepID=UPI000B88C43F|nr:ribonuclease H [Microbacterium oxydans]
MTITAAADGSALGNPGPNGWAWYIDDANWAAGGSPHGTNNQGELRAVLELLLATAGTDEKLMIECDSRYVIDSVTKWMPGWKRKGWRKSDGGPVLNRDLLEGIDEAIRGRDVEFSWVKGHAGHPLNEAADERANAAAKAYQAKQEPRRGPGFTMGTDAGAAVSGSASVAASASSAAATPAAAASTPSPAAAASTPSPAAAASVAEPLWAEASDLLDGLNAPDDDPIELRIPLSSDEHARLRDRAEAQGVSLEEALRRLI